MLVSLALLAALALPPDLSRSYFADLTRPAVPSVRVDRAGGPVIFIVVDALRPDHLSAYGARRDTSPTLRGLADEGLVLTNYFVNANWTRPSTASLFTGLLPSAHGVERDADRLSPELTTLAELLRGAGVPTGAVVGNGNAASAFGFAQGFDFFADTVKHWDGLPSADQVIELAVPFVREHKDEPFFLFLFLVDAHDPYKAPREYENMFVRDPAVPLVRTPHWERGRYSPAEVERMQATYDAAIRYVDDALGRFFSQLRELGVYDQATVVVTADHGEAFGEHGVFLHGHHFYEEIVRAPFIVKAPAMSQRGGYNHYLFQAVDVLPTLARSFGARVPRDLPGVDMFAHLAAPRRLGEERVVISEFNNFGIRRQMIRTHREKLIYEQPANEQEFMATVGSRSLLPSVSFDAERFQLFDLKRDPFEATNLYREGRLAEPRWARLVRTLRSLKRRGESGPSVPVVENVDHEVQDDLRALGYIRD